MICHQRITLVAHSVLFRVNLAQSSLLFATVLTDCLAASFAIVLKDQPYPTKSLTAEHAKPRVKLVHRLQIEDLRQCVFLFSAFILQEDAVHFKRTGLLPSLWTGITVWSTLIFRIRWGIRHRLESHLLFALVIVGAFFLFIHRQQISELIVIMTRV